MSFKDLRLASLTVIEPMPGTNIWEYIKDALQLMDELSIDTALLNFNDWFFEIV